MIFLSSRNTKKSGAAPINDSFFRGDLQRTQDNADLVSFVREYSETLEDGDTLGPDDPDDTAGGGGGGIFGGARKSVAPPGGRGDTITEEEFEEEDGFDHFS